MRRSEPRSGTSGSGRPDPWLTFGLRTSVLTGKPHRAVTPGNALLNYLYAVLEAEMTIALLASLIEHGGEQPGRGMPIGNLASWHLTRRRDTCHRSGGGTVQIE